MTRTNIGPITESDIELPEGLEWDIELGTLNLSTATKKLYFTDSISQSGEFEVQVLGDPGSISDEEKLVVSKEGVGAFSGIVKEPERSSQGTDDIRGGGAAEILRDVPINGEFLNTTTQSVVNSVFDQLNTTRIAIGVNEELSDGSGVVDIRADDEGALSLLNRVVSSHGGEWYTSYNSNNDQFEFNVVNKVESSSVEKTFTENNTMEIKDNPVVDEEYDAVIVRGYGDGEDQVKGEYPDRTNWPDDPRVLKYTDKTILSEGEANNTAESVYNKHTEWRNIYVYPSNMQELRNLGDQVEVNEPRTGLNGTFRVVSRTLSLDFKEGQQIEYVLSDKPLGIIDEAENVQKQTDSQTDYEQGSKNQYSDKQADQSNNANPLKLELRVPDGVVDRSGKNRIKDLTLNYTLKDFRKYTDSDVTVEKDPSNVSQAGSVNTDPSDVSQAGSVDKDPSNVSQAGSVNRPNNVLPGIDTSSTKASAEETSYTSGYKELTSIIPGDTSDVFLGYFAHIDFLFEFGPNQPQTTIDANMEIVGEARSGGALSQVYTKSVTVDPSGNNGPTHITLSSFLTVLDDIFDPGSNVIVTYEVTGTDSTDINNITIVGGLAAQESHEHDDDLNVEEPTDSDNVTGHPHGDNFNVEEPTDASGNTGHPHGDNFNVEEPTDTEGTVGHPHSSTSSTNININEEGRGDSVEIVIDGDTANSITVNGQQGEVDLISEYTGTGLTDPGFHEIEVYPSAASYTIGEVVLDYYKNT